MEALLEYRGLLLEGALVTVELALGSLVLSVALGVAGAWAKLSASRSARRVAAAYIGLVRGVPELLLVLLVHFGGQELATSLGRLTGAWDQVDIHPLATGIVAIGVIFGAYMAEAFRGAYLAIPRGQIEAGLASGMGRRLLFRRIVFPLALRHALPGFTNTWLVQIKATALVSVAGLHDLIHAAEAAQQATRQPFTFYLAVLVCYLVFTALSEAGLRWLERRTLPRTATRSARAPRPA